MREVRHGRAGRRGRRERFEHHYCGHPLNPEDRAVAKQPAPQTDASKIYRTTITTDRGTIVAGSRPAARAEHRQQLRRPRARRLLRRAHVPPGRSRVRDPGRLPRGQRPRRSGLQVRRRAREGRVHARRGRDGELRARTRTARSSSSASTTASASSRRATTCSATWSTAWTSRSATEVGDVMRDGRRSRSATASPEPSGYESAASIRP